MRSMVMQSWYCTFPAVGKDMEMDCIQYLLQACFYLSIVDLRTTHRNRSISGIMKSCEWIISIYWNSHYSVKANTGTNGHVPRKMVIGWYGFETRILVIICVDVKGRLWLPIWGAWRADYIKWGLPNPGHVMCSRAITECWKLCVLRSNSTNIDHIAIWRLGAKRTSKTPRYMNISYCDMIKTKILNWRQRSEFVTMKHCCMQRLAKKLQP